MSRSGSRSVQTRRERAREAVEEAVGGPVSDEDLEVTVDAMRAAAHDAGIAQAAFESGGWVECVSGWMERLLVAPHPLLLGAAREQGFVPCRAVPYGSRGRRVQ